MFLRFNFKPKMLNEMIFICEEIREDDVLLKMLLYSERDLCLFL